MRVVIAGATGCIGRALVPHLRAEGHDVVAGSRTPRAGTVHLDVDDRASLDAALAGADAYVHLVHHLGDGGGDLVARERAAAARVAAAVDDAGVRRVVYVGTLAPRGRRSPHLQARAVTGQVLRRSDASVFELRPGMVVAADSASFRLVDDVARTLPVHALPRWLERPVRPVARDDLVVAIARMLAWPAQGSGVYDVPGPDTLTAAEVVRRVATLAGRPRPALRVPGVPHELASRVLPWFTTADARIVRELVEGLTCDLAGDRVGVWALLDDHRRAGFDEAVRRAWSDAGTAGTR